jgi:aerobic-type carbon monoxide dehydrogenase small subunit (CoxS/CutS family)
MNAVSLLNKNPDPTRLQIIEGMNDNYCRCGAHNQIVDAVESAAKAIKQ